MLNHFSRVMAGLVPAIYVLLAEAPQERRGCPRRRGPRRVTRRGVIVRAWRGRGDSISSERALARRGRAQFLKSPHQWPVALHAVWSWMYKSPPFYSKSASAEA